MEPDVNRETRTLFLERHAAAEFYNCLFSMQIPIIQNPNSPPALMPLKVDEKMLICNLVELTLKPFYAYFHQEINKIFMNFSQN